MSAEASSPKLPTVFDPKKTSVIFVLGGPGAGKGTQSHLLAERESYCHLSAGDLLRAEQIRPGSEYGETIAKHIVEGVIIPWQITVKLLENAMRDSASNKFLIDGFPRKMDQAQVFEETICPANLVLYFECPVEELKTRIIRRSETSGRADDNEESIKKRCVVFKETTMPVINYYKEKGKLVEINGQGDIETIYANVLKTIEERIPGE